MKRLPRRQHTLHQLPTRTRGRTRHSRNHRHHTRHSAQQSRIGSHQSREHIQRRNSHIDTARTHVLADMRSQHKIVEHIHPMTGIASPTMLNSGGHTRHHNMRGQIHIHTIRRGRNIKHTLNRHIRTVRVLTRRIEHSHRHTGRKPQTGRNLNRHA